MGGKSKGTTVGYWYELAIHFGLGIGPFDEYLEFRGGDKTAWSGSATHSQSITINAPNLWGGEKDQGGIVGTLDLMFGEADQQPNARLAAIFGPQQPAWRGLATAVFAGKYGAMNPYPHQASHKINKIKQGWDSGCWYPEKAVVSIQSADVRAPIPGTWPWAVRDVDYFVIGASQEVGGAFVGSQGWWHGYIDSFRITAGVARTAQISYPIPVGPFGDATTDPYYDRVKLLLRMNGADGSTAFTDDVGHPVSAMGGARLSTAQAKWGSSSAYFDGIDSWLKVAMGADVDLGAGPWTMEAWVWLETPDSNPTVYSRAIFGFGPLSVRADDTVWWCRGDSWYFTQFDLGELSQPSVIQNTTPFMETGKWTFVSICFDGARYWLHADGQLLTLAPQEALQTCNPTHALYYARTHSGIGRVPVARMNDASYRAAADKLHAEGFGICTSYDPSSESLDEYEQRICRLIGGSVSRSLVDGQYYLDLARGDYVLDELPIITDDDILDIRLQPSVPNGAINSVQVKYFDPQRKESITTPPVQALSLIDAFGVISQINDYPEIPAGPLALRVAERDVRASTAPTRTMELTLIPDAVQGIRPNQYFRLQSVKRRIADMVCLMGDRQAGTLKSGAVRITATQDIYSLPSTSFGEIEPGVDTRPDPTPNPITLQAAFEAPYIELVQRLDRANLDVLPSDAGYLLAVADQPPGGQSYSLAVAAAGGGFESSATGDWCPLATVAGDATDIYSRAATSIPISAIRRGELLVIGAAALWDTEIVRIDAIDIVAGAVVLGRGCADTVAAEHAGGSLLWLYDAAAVSDLVEYTDGEVVDVKLLTNTGSAQLAPSAAVAMTVEFAGRQARPYPPAAPRLNCEAWPKESFETADVSWLHRDRVAQADQLVDQQMASIGPEPGTTYTVRWFLNGVLVNTAAGVAGTSASFVPTADGALRVEIEAERDGLTSWQMQVIECVYRTSHYSTYTDQDGDIYVDQDGNHYIG